ncbi:MAG: PspC domain-containing protein [Mangrovibacterium sp.]|jgi:phage shock protein C
MKRLRKSKDRIIAGVCGGISEYINPEMDPLIVRLGFVALTIFNPLMVIFYLILLFVMPGPDKI